jgi:GNAT superfamily N-acetyltransferase
VANRSMGPGEVRPPNILEVAPASGEMARVLDMHRVEKGWLGFLPDAGFADRAARGTLLIALFDGAPLAYVLYDLPGNWVKIVHLCVAPEAKGAGLARALVEELSLRHPACDGVTLSCRRSYPAATLWPRLGFRPVADRTGRSHNRDRLTIWVRDHGNPNLLSLVEDDRELAAVDQNVFEDLVADGSHGEESRRLFDDWVEELIELCVTDQVCIESNECEENELRAVLLAEANSWRNLSSGNQIDVAIQARVAELAPKAGVADHRHVAAAIAGGADYFISRDGDLLLGAEDIVRDLDIRVIRPEELIDHLDRRRRVGLYVPAALQGTEIQDSRLVAADQERYISALLGNPSGERASAFRSVVRSALADPSQCEVRVLSDAEGILGGAIRRPLDGVLQVDALRVAGGDATARALARQLAFGQREEAASRRLGEVIVTDSHLSVAVREALRAERFEPREEGGWSCRVEVGLVDADRLDLRPSDAVAAIAIERSRWPLKLARARITTYVISIERPWAEALFETNLAAETFFPRSLGLALSREHVYYRASRPTGIRAPARLLWYVKGGEPAHSIGHLRALSYLTDVVVGRPEQLHRRFSNLGAWDLDQVRGAAGGSGLVMALRFSDTEVLARPLHLDQVHAIYREAGARFQPPQSPMPVPEQVFDRLYRQSSAYGE